MKTLMFPGQGSQFRGMGKELFGIFKKETRLASEILGYDLEELCVADPSKKLGNTRYTQPALFVVNAFRYQNYFSKLNPNFLIGHSLGEYNALLAAEVFDFETGLKLVKKRGELMAKASGGGMAAVLGMDESSLKKKIKERGFSNINIANYNTPFQMVLAGQKEPMDALVKDFDTQNIKIIPLFVSAPFHSPYMESAAIIFKEYLQEFNFYEAKIPVISNVTAKPYGKSDTRQLLAQQITSSVLWTDSITYLLQSGVAEFQEIGGEILSKMVAEIKKNISTMPKTTAQTSDNQKILKAASLGNAQFKKDYNTKYSYYSGSMYRGIASKELVVRMGENNMLSFLGTGGMSVTEVENNIDYIQSALQNNEPYGLNLLHNFMHLDQEMRMINIYLKKGVKNVEASAFMQITKSLVYFKAKGLLQKSDGTIEDQHNIIAKISRPEVAEVFMKPAPQRIINQLLDENLITDEQADLLKLVPISFDICVEADSGGHTDGGVALTLLPSIQSLRKRIESEEKYFKNIRVGLAGGIGTPQAVACAFIMQADFIATGSINQCTVESGMSATVKDILEDIDVQDTEYAPAGDMFELGSKVQVLKKGVLFPARANKLFALYNQYGSLESLPDKMKKQLEKNYFKKPIDEVWRETETYLVKAGREADLKKALTNPKTKMAMVFKWYFRFSSQLSFQGDILQKANFQIHTGPALGAFNQWVKGTNLESWKNRHVDQIGSKLMEEGYNILSRSTP